MKRILKKNQLIMTTLAALIAVAGYLNHIENSEKDLTKVNSQAETGTKKINGEADEQSTTGVGENATEDMANAADSKDIESNDLDMDSNPGEAVLVNAVGTVDFVVEAKLLREQNRATSKEMLMQVVNDAKLTENEKKAAVEKIASLTDISERELAAETLISAKGYENVVVTITDDEADVMIVSDVLTDAQRAQIEDIVKTKANVTADKITITTVKTNDEE